MRYADRMLPIAALPLFIRYFDGVDAAAVSKLMRKVPRDEPAITSELCDLLDEDYSDEYSRPYSLKEFRKNVSAAMPLAQVSLQVDTHQYSAQMERWVTQSDIGLVLSYEDHYLPSESWTRSLLLQAKRLFPSGPGPLYHEASRFESVNSDQHKRINELNTILRCELIKYMLYCPRPKSLDELTEAKLAHLRNFSLEGNIFDYMRGLALHRELEAGGGSLAAGIFVSRAELMPKTLAGTHRSIFRSTVPLSWLIALEFANAGHSDDWWPEAPFGVDHSSLDATQREIVAGIMSGDEQVTHAIGILFGRNPDYAPLRLLPKHTVRINVSAGGQADPERRRIVVDNL